MPPDVLDTIVAPATAPGEGGIAIVRVSGARAQEVLAALFRAADGVPVSAWPSHRLTYGRVVDGEAAIDEAMAVVLRAPRSYTREDVAEVHCHGGAWVVREVLRLALVAGARPAEPGEFTRRAFLHGRIDLAQAEAVMALIGAEGAQAARTALRQMQGNVSRRVAQARAEAVRLLAGAEAALDFPDEVDEAEAAGSLGQDARALAHALRAACDARGGKLLREGLDVVIAGRPNAGKSTLLNALLGEERAIVTEVPGTTRDLLTERIVLDGLVLQLTDTAGLRESGDRVEAEGIARAQAALARADVQLIVLDASEPLDAQDAALLRAPSEVPRIVALNKGDLPACLRAAEVSALAAGAQVLSVTASTGEGLAALRGALRAQAAQPERAEGALTQARHIAAAARAADALEAAADALAAGIPLDLAAIDLRAALRALGEITGEEATEDVLDAVFSAFCVGK